MNNNDDDKKNNLNNKIDKGIQIITDKFESINNSIQQQYKKNIDVIANGYSEDTNNKIATIEKKENLTFIGGHLKARLDDSRKKLILSLDLYFQNNLEKIILKSTENSLNSDVLSPQSFEELSKNEEVKFPVEYSRE